MQRSTIFIIITALLLLGSCSRRPSYVLSENKMAEVLYDIQIAQAIYNRSSEFGTNEKKDALVEGVLRKHKVSQAELDSSLLWYSDNIAYYEAINDSVASRLSASNKKMMDKLNKPKGKVRRTDLLIPPFYNLNTVTPTFAFDLDSFRIKKLDLSRFNIRFDVQGLNALQKVEAAVFFTYKDTLIKKIVPLDKNESYTFSKPHLADSLLKGVSGYVHLSDRGYDLPLNISLYNISYIDSLSSNVPVQAQSDLPAPTTNKPSPAAESVKPVEAKPATPAATEQKDRKPTAAEEELNRISRGTR
ncbi:DUF4296 domain-containing protein [Dysgonomonas sp. OttesenSCG-928-D17]|nr:DUF4296 domain-containing protein [Dysgonomonas sp. OttesenSCG-928-D17]